MSFQTFIRTVRVARSDRDVFAWHEGPGVLARLTPPWERVEVVAHEGVRSGARATIRSRAGGRWWQWEVEHRDFIEWRQFRDVQRAGPFAMWEHLHAVVAESAGACVLRDEIRYALPGGAVGRAIGGGWVRRKLEKLFAYRHAVMTEDLAMQLRYGAVRKMRIAIAGASGLVGSALEVLLAAEGHEVVRLVRRPARSENEISWDPAAGRLDPHALRGVDAVVNLAGENLAGGRWTQGRRDRIWNSRVESARTLVAAIEKMRHRPFVLVSASATGIYGDNTHGTLDDEGGRGTGFLADLCDAWEREAAGAATLDVRTVALRFGVVLTPAGGALAQMLPFFRAGLGGRLGHGRQWMSWVSIDDAVGAIYHAILHRSCSGPVNVTAPNPVTNAEFTRTLGRVLGRPAVLPVPGWVLRARFGGMAGEVLLVGARACPRRLTETGYVFRHERLEPALRHLLGRMSENRVRRRGGKTKEQR